MPEAILRFAVGSPSGPQSGIWQVWANPKGDVYVAGRLVGHHFKASLHRTGRWRVGYTEAQARRLGLPPSVDRAILKWTAPPEFAPGVRRAFAVIVPSSEVTGPPAPMSDDPSICWRPVAQEGMATVFTIFFATRPVAFADVHEIGRLTIPGKRILCTVETAGEEPETRAVREQERRQLLQGLGNSFPDAMPNEVRSAVVGVLPNGTVCFTDIVLR